MRWLSRLDHISPRLWDGHTTLAAAADLAVRSFPFFLRFVTTQNEIGKNKFRVERLPVDDRPFLLECARAMEEDDTLWIAKSRRMFMTWLCSAELIWLGLRPHGHMFVQQTKEEDSDWLVEKRCKFIWDHLPEWLRFYAMGGKGIEADKKYCKMRLPNDSEIWGIAQGGEQFRKYTATGIFSDEVAIQPDFRNAHTAISALAEDGCKVRFVSSARGGTHFAKMVNGTPVAGTLRSPMRGIQRWELETGGHVLRVHYTADPTKDPQRSGDSFIRRYSKKFDGGTEGSDWKQEMEIDFMAKHGTRVYENFDPASDRCVVQPFDAEFLHNHPGPYFRALDYGLRNPTACLWLTEWDGVYYAFREFYKPGLTPEALKQAIYALSTESRYAFTVIDPRSDRHDVATLPSAFYLLNAGEYSLNARKANSAATGIDLIRQWFSTGRLKVTSNCVHLIKELSEYVYEDWTGLTEEKHNVKEQVRKKDDHLCDALKYFANGVQHKEYRPAPPKPAEQVNRNWLIQRQNVMRGSRNRRVYAGQSTIMRGYYG